MKKRTLDGALFCSKWHMYCDESGANKTYSCSMKNSIYYVSNKI